MNGILCLIHSQVSDMFKKKLKEGKTIGIISEAGCPGVADPGQSSGNHCP